MIHHYMTKYKDEGEGLVIESWIQLDLFGMCFCLSRRSIRLKRPPEGGPAAEHQTPWKGWLE